MAFFLFLKTDLSFFLAASPIPSPSQLAALPFFLHRQRFSGRPEENSGGEGSLAMAEDNRTNTNSMLWFIQT